MLVPRSRRYSARVLLPRWVPDLSIVECRPRRWSARVSVRAYRIDKKQSKKTTNDIYCITLYTAFKLWCTRTGHARTTVRILCPSVEVPIHRPVNNARNTHVCFSLPIRIAVALELPHVRYFVYTEHALTYHQAPVWARISNLLLYSSSLFGDSKVA